MDFSYSEKVEKLRAQLLSFIEREVAPRNQEWSALTGAGTYPTEIIERLKAKAFEEGLWNLFLPGLKDNEPGTRLTNLEYAPLAEIMGRFPWCSEVFNCSAPDTGNMEVLHLFATPEQRKQWLEPLLIGDLRSVVSITEPDTASSDPTNLETTIRREGDEYVINGRKWFSSGALHPKFAFAMVMGVSTDDKDAPRHARHSFIIVPADAKGVEVVRDVPIMHHHAPDGHCELLFQNVRVPATNLIGEEGQGFLIAQARLGPGRVHHCMRTIGQCELALEMMCDRALSRTTFGKTISENANIQDWIASSRMEIDQARLLMLQTAWLMDKDGNKAARTAVSSIKVVAANLQCRVLDRAIQVFGAAGLTPDTSLSFLWTWGRAFRIFDGPDEVHMRGIARAELKKSKAAGPRNTEHYFYRTGPRAS